ADGAGTQEAPSPAPEADRAAERALLRQARTALGRGRPGDALSALRAHRARYPTSSLAEERMALEVRALEAAGRPDEAARLRARFVERFPASIFRELVEVPR
ncbi:MAG TPA: hypothetical protein RMH99_21065, partial [Sandaracinaceae bacterium LLY-WYZ-13_1]|nr:hypothetical protein [Sandaracinaceae bacterium LLY-WYZ-13_1]